jgi:hypothetical protein
MRGQVRNLDIPDPGLIAQRNCWHCHPNGRHLALAKGGPERRRMGCARTGWCCSTHTTTILPVSRRAKPENEITSI